MLSWLHWFLGRRVLKLALTLGLLQGFFLGITLGMTAPSRADENCAGSLLHLFSRDQTELTLKRVAVVSDNNKFKIVRGSAPLTEADFELLKSLGINTIVTLEIIPHDIEKEEAMAARYGIHVVRAPIEGSTLPPSETSVNRALADLRDKSLGKIYVHCALGRDRTSLVVALHRIYDEGYSPRAALEEAESFGFIPQGIHRLTLWGLYHYFDTHAALDVANPN